jgi:hypothetical protein
LTFSNSFENIVLDAILGADAVPSPHSLMGSTLEVALSSTNPTEDGSGITEPVGNGYIRKEISNDAIYWGAAVDGEKTNSKTIIFAQASGAWGTMTHWAIYDTGVFKIYGEITDVSGNSSPQYVDDGDVVNFLPGALKITLD